MNITAEGTAICAIGKSFNTASFWPLSTICPINAFPVTSLTNSSGIPIWCTWPFLTCNPRSKSVVSFDSQYKGNYWWIQGGTTLPTAFGSLPNLQRLSLNNAKLTGTLPASIFSSLSQLTYLNLAGNSLEGTIPSTINVAFVPLQGKAQIDLSGNYLTGEVPSTFMKLQYMYLNNFKTQWSLSYNCFLTSSVPSVRSSFGNQGYCVTPHSSGLMSLRLINCHIVVLLTFTASFGYSMYSQHRSLPRVKPYAKLPKHCRTLS